MEDTIKVIVDYHYAKKKSKIDTGEWQLICRKKLIESNPVNACGLNFICEGVKMKVKKAKPGVPTKSPIAIKELSFGDPIAVENQKVDEVMEADDIEEEEDDLGGEGDDNDDEGEDYAEDDLEEQPEDIEDDEEPEGDQEGDEDPTKESTSIAEVS